MTPARLDFAAWRNEPRILYLRCVGLNLVGVPIEMQTRLGTDVPGPALIDLLGGGSPTVQGLWLAGMEVVDGVPVSTIGIRIDTATVQGLPYAGEVGDATDLAYAIQIDGQTKVYGTLRILASAYGSDGAPANRPPAYGAASNGSGLFGTAQLAFLGDAVTVTVDGVALTAPYAARAEQASSAAAGSAAIAVAASATAPGVYPNLAAGLAGTADGKTFWAAGARRGATLYRRNGAAASAITAIGGGPVTLSSVGGAPGARTIVKVTATAGSTTLVATSGAFVAADVGQMLVVVGAGADGGKLVTTITALDQTGAAVMQDAAATSTAGAGAAVGTDAGPALQAALDAIRVNGGGTLLVDGVYLLRTPVTCNLGASTAIRGSGGDSGFLIALDPTQDAITIASTPLLAFEHVNFAGLPNEQNDGRRILSLSTSDARISMCGFYGFANNSVSDAAVILADQCQLTIEDSTFGGNAVASGYNNCVVQSRNFVGFYAKRNRCIDYGTFQGVYLSKTGFSFALAWFAILDQFNDDANAVGQSAVRVEDCRFDEGHIFAILIETTAGTGRRISRVHLAGIQANNSLVDGASAISISSADHVVIEQVAVGWRNTPGDCIQLANCGEVLVDQVKITAGAPGTPTGMPDGLKANNVTSLTLKDAGDISRLNLTGVTRLLRKDAGMGAVLPFSKAGRITDADFTVPPPFGTLAADVYNQKLYVRTASGWLATAALAPSTDPTFVLDNLSPSTGTQTGADTLTKNANGTPGWDTGAVLDTVCTGAFAMTVKLLALGDFALGAVAPGTSTPASPPQLMVGLALQPNGSATVAVNANYYTTTTYAAGDTLRLVVMSGRLRVYSNGNATPVIDMAAPDGAVSLQQHEFGGAIYTPGAGYQLLEYGPAS